MSGTDFVRTGAPYQLGMGMQTALDVWKDPTIFIPFTTFQPDNGITDTQLTGHTGKRSTDILEYRDKVLPKATLDSAAWPEAGLEHILTAALGDCSSTQQASTAAYKHTITEDPTPVYLSLIDWAGPNITDAPMAYKNCLIDTVKLDYKEGLIDCNTTFFTSPVDLSKTAPAAETVSYTQSKPFVFKNFIASLGGYGTFTFASTDVTTSTNTITEPQHNMNTGDGIKFTTAGTLPTGLTADTTYYVIYVDADTFKVATTVANAKVGTAITLSAAGSGTSTVNKGVPIANSYVTAANIQITNNVFTTAIANQSYDPLKTPGALQITGHIEFPFFNMDELRNYIGGNAQATTVDDVIRDRSLELKLVGHTIESTYKYTLDINLPKIALTPCTITRDDKKLVSYGFDFRAFGDASNTMATIDVISKLTAVS